LRVGLLVFNTTFNNVSVISWRSVLFVEFSVSGVPGEKHLLLVSFSYKLYHIMLYRYDNVTLSPLLHPARITNRSHSTYGRSAQSDSHRAVFCPNSVVSGWKN
jgi:hypothetical protein